MKKYNKGQKNNYIQKFIFILFLLGITTILLNVYMNIEIDNYSNAEEGVKNKAIENNTNDNGPGIKEVIEEITQCVVGISKLENNGITVFLEGGTEALGLGTGIIVSEDGYIITNQHIAGNKYSKCYVTLYDGREYEGEVLWASKDVDLAILKIKGMNLKYVKFGDSNKLRVGEKVYAIGNPVGFEFQRTVTSGIISGLNRTVKIENKEEKAYMEGLIQTDAAINIGNSGGPLINESGEVIGINSIKIDSAEGMGFAIPINMIKPILNTIIAEGEFEQASLGLLAYDKEVIPYVDTTIKIDNGIYVVQVIYDGPAYKAGIREKDIITQIDGIKIEKIQDLREYIYTKKAGETVNVKIKRKNKIIDIAVQLGKMI